jgi:hypothetical protein
VNFHRFCNILPKVKKLTILCIQFSIFCNLIPPLGFYSKILTEDVEITKRPLYVFFKKLIIIYG